MLDLNKIYCGSCLEVLKTFPDACVDCSGMFMAILTHLPKAFSFVKNWLFHKSFLDLTTTFFCRLRVFVFSKSHNATSLHRFFYQIRSGCFYQIISHFVRSTINRHNFATLKTAYTLINSWLCTQRATKGFLYQFKNWSTIHSYLDSFGISRTINIFSVSHTPRGFLDTYVCFAVKYARYICNYVLFHIVSYTTKRKVCQVNVG